MTVDGEIAARILDKAEHVDESVGFLSQKQELDREAYLSDWEQQAIVERTFQTAIEACLDIAELLIKTSNGTVPPTNAEKFAVCADLGVLSPDTAEQMQKAAGFRNVLAHNYGHDIDDETVYIHLQEDLHWFPVFLREVRSTLDS